MSEEKIEVGVEELKELLDLLLKLGEVLAEHLSDGVDASDALKILVELLSAPEFKEGLEGLGKLGGEIKDLSVEEGVGLALHLAMGVPRILDKLKKEAA